MATDERLATIVKELETEVTVPTARYPSLIFCFCLKLVSQNVGERPRLCSPRVVGLPSLESTSLLKLNFIWVNITTVVLIESECPDILGNISLS